MPKAWNDQEKELIQKNLKEEGKKLFERYGLQKTTVDEIVQAARISKGGFYLLYKSKEELYFDIIETVEYELRQQLFHEMIQPGMTRHDAFKNFLKRMIDFLVNEPIFRQLNSLDYERLLRKLPEEAIERHIKRDTENISQYLSSWVERGWIKDVDSEALNGLFLSLFYLIIHRNEIVRINFEATIELWIDMLSHYLVLEDEE
jgi:AcrR family transcriptional regulator